MTIAARTRRPLARGRRAKKLTIAALRDLLRGHALTIEIQPNGAVWVYPAEHVRANAAAQPEGARDLLSNLSRAIGVSHRFHPSIAISATIDGKPTDQTRYPRIEIHPSCVSFT